MFAEPRATAYDLNFTLLGIPVRVHPLFWLIAVLLGRSRDPVMLLIWVGVVFVSILVHEFGHALCAQLVGWPPLRVILYSFGGLAVYQPTYRNPYCRIGVSFAGPGAGFIFAVVILLVLGVFGYLPVFHFGIPKTVPSSEHWLFITEYFSIFSTQPIEGENLHRLVLTLLYVNIFWGLLNLLPIYPLDGGQIARELLTLNEPRDAERQSLQLSILVAVIMCVLSIAVWQRTFLALLFGYLAYNSYQALQFSNFSRWDGGRR